MHLNMLFAIQMPPYVKDKIMISISTVCSNFCQIKVKWSFQKNATTKISVCMRNCAVWVEGASNEPENIIRTYSMQFLTL